MSKKEFKEVALCTSAFMGVIFIIHSIIFIFAK